MKILIADSYYPEFLHSIPFDTSSTYEAELQKVLDYKFGTFDAYSRNLRALGHDVIDIIANAEPLQEMWARENKNAFDAEPTYNMWSILQTQIAAFNPDVVFLQDLSIDVLPRPGMQVCGQLSCPWPGDFAVTRCSLIFTSFPHYVPRIEALGVRAVYLPLAFEPSVLEGPTPERYIDIAFVGGVGRDSHWRQGTDTLELIAQTFPDRFQWWGYGCDRLPADSALRACYRGQAWGRDMYNIYRRAKIVINRHGEVAEGYANNMRMYEATGCGAFLITDNALTARFNPGEILGYDSPTDAVKQIKYILAGYDKEPDVAEAAQKRTIRDHTYAQRMKVVSDALLAERMKASVKLGNYDGPISYAEPDFRALGEMEDISVTVHFKKQLGHFKKQLGK